MLIVYRADTEGVMAFLLSEIIISLAQNPKYTTFDLGFVPLALIGKQASSKALFKLGKKALKPVFSAQGLEQFKNKFDIEKIIVRNTAGAPIYLKDIAEIGKGNFIHIKSRSKAKEQLLEEIKQNSLIH